MRSTTDLREVSLPTDVDGAEAGGAAMLCIVGASTPALPDWVPIELEAPWSVEPDKPPDDGEPLLRGLNTVPDRWGLEGADRLLKSREGALLGAGAVACGWDGCDGADLPENGLERIVAGGLLGLNDGLEDGALGVNEGLEGVNDGDRLGVNDGLEGAIDDDLPENPELELGLMASRLEAISFITELRPGPA